MLYVLRAIRICSIFGIAALRVQRFWCKWVCHSRDTNMVHVQNFWITKHDSNTKSCSIYGHLLCFVWEISHPLRMCSFTSTWVLYFHTFYRNLGWLKETVRQRKVLPGITLTNYHILKKVSCFYDANRWLIVLNTNLPAREQQRH